MARIRTIKPEFWQDETIGTLSPSARLLFIATWNLADDEGLLKWTPQFVKASVFMYDDTITADTAAHLMNEVAEAGLVFPYAVRGGAQMAYVVNFRRHQKINRPQASRNIAPNPDDPATALMYARRDGWRCGVCGTAIDEQAENIAVGRLLQQSDDNAEHPSNIVAAHRGCITLDASPRRAVTTQIPLELDPAISSLEEANTSDPTDTGKEESDMGVYDNPVEPFTDLRLSGAVKRKSGKAIDPAIAEAADHVAKHFAAARQRILGASGKVGATYRDKLAGLLVPGDDREAYTAAQVCDLIDFALSHDFWHKHTSEPGGLVKHFTRLYMSDEYVAWSQEHHRPAANRPRDGVMSKNRRGRNGLLADAPATDADYSEEL